jgi:hypothetical protein
MRTLYPKVMLLLVLWEDFWYFTKSSLWVKQKANTFTISHNDLNEKEEVIRSINHTPLGVCLTENNTIKSSKYSVKYR